MLRAVLRPEKEQEVVRQLAEAGFPAFTRMEVSGRGKQGGVQIGMARYEEMAKVLLLLVVEDEEVERAAEVIITAARTGNFGDGRIFITPLEKALTIRLAKKPA